MLHRLLLSILLIISCFVIKAQQTFDAGSVFHNGFSHVRKGDKYFYIDSSGKYAFDSLLNYAYDYSSSVDYADSSLAKQDTAYDGLPQNFNLVSKKNKEGVLTLDGKWLLQPIYDSIDTHLLTVWTVKKDAKISIYTSNGFLLPFLFEDVNNLNERFFNVKKDGKWGIYDSKASKLITPCIYQDIDYWYGCQTKGDHVFAERNGKWGVIDFYNNVLLPFEYDHEHSNMRSDEHIEFLSKNGTPLSINLKTKKTDTLSLNDEDSTENMSAGFVRSKRGSKYGLKNAAGKLILDYEYDYIRNDSLEITAPFVMLNKNEKYGLADTTGKIIIPTKYDQWFLSICDSFFISGFDGKEILFDKNGNKVLPKGYDEINMEYLGSTDSSKKIIQFAEGNEWGFYNLHTKKIVPPQFNYIYTNFSQSGDTIKVTDHNKTGLVDAYGNILMPLVYEEVSPLVYGYEHYLHNDTKASHLFVVQKNSQRGVYDTRLKKLIVPEQYIFIDKMPKGMLWVQKEYKASGILDSLGNNICPVLPFQEIDAADTTSDFIVIIQKDSLGNFLSFSVLNTENRQTYKLPYDTVVVGGYADRVGVRIANNQYALYDLKNRKIIPGEYSQKGYPQLVYPIQDKASIVCDKKVGVINAADGKIIIQPLYYLIKPFSNGIAMYVQKNDEGKLLYGFGDYQGNIKVPIQYDYAEEAYNYLNSDTLLLLLKKDNSGNVLKGYASLSGEITLPPIYEAIWMTKDGKYYLVRQNHRYGILQNDGKEILPVTYDDILLSEKNQNNNTAAFDFPLSALKDGIWKYYDIAGIPVGIMVKDVIFYNTQNIVQRSSVQGYSEMGIRADNEKKLQDEKQLIEAAPVQQDDQ